MKEFKILVLIFSAMVLVLKVKADKACAPRKISGQSVVCVCTADYCDEITRETPSQGTYVAYMSSEAGLRFKKVTGNLTSSSNKDQGVITLTLNPGTRFQTVEGFGGAVTDSAGINWKNLSDANLQQKLVDSYFSERGIEYNMLRVPIGGCDFSTHAYAYNESPRGDAKLKNFSLSFEDYEYKIPLIKAINAAATDAVHIVATTWSPATWMKTNDEITGFSRLRHEYYQTYADYHLKFLEKYFEAGVPVWGITTTNEPINGVTNWARFNTLGWTPNSMGEWITLNLGPTIRNSTFKDIKIITGDDQRITLPFWFNVMIDLYPEALQYIDGLGVHYYTDNIVPASVLSFVTRKHPDKFVLATEACEGSQPWVRRKVILGSWQRAKNYIVDIIQDMNQNVVGWIDWNLCLNAEGGPNWAKNFVDSPIIVLPERKEFVKQPMFYALGHFSKFIPRGSRRIELVEKKSIFTPGVEHLAFLTPRDTVVAVVYNDRKARKVCLKLGDKTVDISMEAKSVVTVEIPYKN